MREATAYAMAHLVELPQYPKAALSSSPSSMTVGYGNQSLSATPAVTGDPANVGVPSSTGDTLAAMRDPVNMAVPPSTSGNIPSPGAGAPMDTHKKGPSTNTGAM